MTTSIPPMRPEEQQVVLFDGFCYLCSWVVRLILTQDRNDRFICLPLQSPEGIILVAPYAELAAVDSVILVEKDRVLTRTRAIFGVLKGLGGFWRLFLAISIFPTTWLDTVYDWVARVRYRAFGKRTNCVIPPRRLRHKLELEVKP